MKSIFDGGIAPANSCVLVMGVTGAWAFAAGTALQSFRRYSRDMGSDIIVFSDGMLSADDAALLRRLGARIVPFSPPDAGLSDEAIRLFSPLSLAKFECFSLLGLYRHVVWLDADVIIQDDLGELFGMGPFAIAREDPQFSEPPDETRAGINLYADLAGFDSSAANLNSGVLAFRNDLPQPLDMRNRCLDFIAGNGEKLRYPDQAAFNFLAQRLQVERPQALKLLPAKFNMHPRNPRAAYAPVVHAFGAYKLWDDGLTATCFPEWQRDYARWQKMGGSCYAGVVENSEYLAGSAFSMLGSLCSTIERAGQTIAALQGKLERSESARVRLEALLNGRGSAQR